MKRGETRWCTFRPLDKSSPVFILSRNKVIDHLNEIIVVPVTRTIRGLTTEVVLTEDDGLPVTCALNSITLHSVALYECIYLFYDLHLLTLDHIMPRS